MIGPPHRETGAHDDRERVRAAADAGAVLAVVLGDGPGAAPDAVSGLPTAEVALLLFRLLLLRSGARGPSRDAVAI